MKNDLHMTGSLPEGQLNNLHPQKNNRGMQIRILRCIRGCSLLFKVYSPYSRRLHRFFHVSAAATHDPDMIVRERPFGVDSIAWWKKTARTPR